MLSKILNKDQLKKKINLIKKNKKKIVLCHGVFDLIHIGHIKHFKKAKEFGDILFVTITSDKFVKKGPGKPLFNERMRAEFLSSLKIVDYIYINNEETSINLINIIKPKFYVKGNDYRMKKNDITRNIYLEENSVKKNGGKIVFTNEDHYSSSKIINSNSDLFNEEQINYFKNTKKYFDSNSLQILLKKIKKLNVLVIGETIIDQYNFCEVLGKSGKDPFLTFQPKKSQDYLGGAAAIANNASVFCKKVDLVSMIGEKKEYYKFIKKNLKNNVSSFLINKKNSPTMIIFFKSVYTR